MYFLMKVNFCLLSIPKRPVSLISGVLLAATFALSKKPDKESISINGSFDQNNLVEPHVLEAY